MTQHFTRNTVSVAFYCSKCERKTQHRIDDGRKGPCLECIAKLEAFHRKAEAEKQKGLFE
jgi:ribosomal protein L44E